MPLRRLESAFSFQVWGHVTILDLKTVNYFEGSVAYKHIFYIGLNTISFNQKIRLFKQDGGWGIKRSFIPFLGY